MSTSECSSSWTDCTETSVSPGDATTLSDTTEKSNSAGEGAGESDTSSGGGASSSLLTITSDDMETDTDVTPETLEDELLYPGAELTVLHANLLLMQYALKHSLTKTAITNLLDVLRVLLPRGHKLPTSFHLIKKFFEKKCPEVTQLKTVSFCSLCHSKLEEVEKQCPNGCSKAVQDFLYIPIAPQLKRMAKDSHIGPVIFKECRSYWKGRDSGSLGDVSDGKIRDVYDGCLYRKHLNFLSTPGHVSFMMNTDGVQIFRSSTTSIWPIWLVMNELPPNERFSKRNMLLCGLWFSKDKPTMTTFLSPLVDELNFLYVHGVSVECEGRPGQVCRAVLLMACCDLPARAAVLNQKQFNGDRACCFCEDSGRPRTGLPQVRDWPFIKQTDCVLRSRLSWKQSVETAIASCKPDKGIKGASILMTHPPFSIPRGIVLDVLHFLFLGVVLTQLNYLFGKPHRNKSCSIYSKTSLCDQRLLSVKVPDVISRPPKSIREVNRWKGSELRAWLLFYCVPVLEGVLNDEYLEHLCYLVAAFHLLLGDCISGQDLTFANECLVKFYSKAEELYGSSFQTMNIHMLRHAVQCVFDWGPLWAYSCFPFEGMNRQIKTFFHGCRNMNKQLAFSYIMSQTLPALALEAHAPSVERKRSTVNTGLGCQLVGKPFQSGSGYIYYKAVVNGVLFYSKHYKRVKTRNSYTVSYLHKDGHIAYAQIQYFEKSNTIEDYPCSAVIHPLIPLSFPLKRSSNLIKVREDVRRQMVPISALRNKCLFINIEKSLYVAVFPNFLYYD